MKCATSHTNHLKVNNKHVNVFIVILPQHCSADRRISIQLQQQIRYQLSSILQKNILRIQPLLVKMALSGINFIMTLSISINKSEVHNLQKFKSNQCFKEQNNQRQSGSDHTLATSSPSLLEQ